jgi:hypothetical protein
LTSRIRTGAVLVAALALITTAVTSAAAASHAAPQANAAFAGYEVAKPKTHVHLATATFVVPTITCKKNFSGVGPSVVVVTVPNKHNVDIGEIAGVGVGCPNLTPTYVSIISINNKSYDQPLSAGDKVTVTVALNKTRTKITIDDITSGTSETRTAAGKIGANAFIGDEGVSINHMNGGLDPFTKTAFTGVKVNGKSLAAEKAQAFNWVHAKKVLIGVSKLTKGEAFDLTYKHS